MNEKMGGMQPPAIGWSVRWSKREDVDEQEKRQQCTDWWLGMQGPNLKGQLTFVKMV